MKKVTLYFFLVLIFCDISFASSYLTDLKKKADAGDAIAQNELGYLYLYGNKELGVSIDLDTGIDYLNKAAEQDQVNAMTTIGWNYFLGSNGAEQNDEEAIYWNKRASDLGFTIASYNMGFFYYSGLAGLKQDLLQAKKYWLLSASQWIDSPNHGDSTPDDLLDEINSFNENPSKEMIKLRDWFISLLKSISV
jgi:TPR repeat protein